MSAFGDVLHLGITMCRGERPVWISAFWTLANGRLGEIMLHHREAVANLIRVYLRSPLREPQAAWSADLTLRTNAAKVRHEPTLQICGNAANVCFYVVVTRTVPELFEFLPRFSGRRNVLEKGNRECRSMGMRAGA